jgi:hypothetical protein
LIVFYWYIAFNAFLKASLKMIPDGIDGMVHFLHGINGILYWKRSTQKEIRRAY